uniref:Uncharacterized protein n=1 Tax=Ascaris lumbricoides TaxID=6252 RepID=A0A9J2P3Q8_ASCLU
MSDEPFVLPQQQQRGLVDNVGSDSDLREYCSNSAHPVVPVTSGMKTNFIAQQSDRSQIVSTPTKPHVGISLQQQPISIDENVGMQKKNKVSVPPINYRASDEVPPPWKSSAEDSSFAAFPSPPPQDRVKLAEPAQTSAPTTFAASGTANGTMPTTPTIISNRQATRRPPYVDEEVGMSPFEVDGPEGDRLNIQPKVRTSAAVAQQYTTYTPQPGHMNSESTPAVPSFELKSPFDVSSDIRRAPIKKPWRRTGAEYKPFIGFPSMPTNKIVNDFIFPTFIDEVSTLTAFDTLDRDNAPSLARPNSVKGEYMDNAPSGSANHNMLESLPPSPPSHPVPVDERKYLPRMLFTVPSSTNKGEAFNEYEVEHFSENGLMEEYNEPDYATYDPLKFYHTPPPKRPSLNEKILTFCTKEIAIRDSNNLVIACGSDSEVWLPHRCPAGSECFLSSDSLYRICCAVADAVSYTK